MDTNRGVCLHRLVAGLLVATSNFDDPQPSSDLTARNDPDPIGTELSDLPEDGHQLEAAGAPHDGLDSLHLPIDVIPATDLADGDGNFTMQHRVVRFIYLGGMEIDCAAPPPEGGQASSCAVAVGAIDDHDQSGVVGVTFDADIPLLPESDMALSELGLGKGD